MARGRKRLAVAVALVAGTAVLAGRSREPAVPVARPIVVRRAFVEVADTVRRNETLSEVFARQQIVGGDLLRVLDALDGLNPRRIRADKIFEFRYAVGDEVPEWIRVRMNDSTFLTASRGPAGWAGAREAIAWTIGTERVVGEVRSSLYQTVDDLIPDSVMPAIERGKLIDDLADGVYAWQIDFTRDLRPGDEFVVIYERLVSSLGEVKYGRVLAANVETARHENPAYVLSDQDGRNAYYDHEGRSLRRAFKMYPVKFRRISSGFSRSRRHPVLHTTRAHLGTDFAADPGTPIYATADGTVIRAGRWGGYGIMVALRHPRGIETRYAHMQGLAKGIRSGTRVRQDELIGFVGMTGVANGPHVHYEFLKNGRHINPRRADLGDGEPVPSARRAEFDAVRAGFDRLLGRPASQATAKVD
jgi:murein DD-endopeptidase MepM/ murein hydrolase activator NlpD